MQYGPFMIKSLKKMHKRYVLLLFPKKQANIIQRHAHISGQVQSLQT